MVAAQNRSRVGEVRPSQVLFAAGPAAVVDLPNMSVIVMGTDDWELAGSATVTEPRLLAQVREKLGERGSHVAELRLPPVAPEGADANPFDVSAMIGVPVAPFPGWLLCPQCRLLAPISSQLFRLKPDPYRSDKTRYIHENCPKYSKATVIPARFLVACTNGHMDDFPWSFFLHNGDTDCTGSIRLIEYGLSGTAADIELRCDACSTMRRMSDAFGDRAKRFMPRCRGRHPHLRTFAEEQPCREQMRGTLLGASNSWFPISLKALSIPVATSKAAQAVERNLAVLGGATSLEGLRGIFTAFKAIGQFSDLTAHTPEEVWAEVEKQRAGGADDDTHENLKPPEWRAFSQANSASNTPDFRLAPIAPPLDYESYFEKTVLVEHVREVSALLGFTRIESAYDFAEGEELRPEAWGPLGRSNPRWVPVSETRGEGIFLHFKESALKRWVELIPKLRDYGAATFEAHHAWRLARNIPNPERHFPGLRYMLLHSFAHALMRQLAIECGYSAASLSERIYSAESGEDDGPMAGVLIYTSAPDSEGTLGGLVSLGEPATLGRHIDQALDSIALCASDPLCAEHDPREGSASLHWASCHSCLFAPETSCERGNRYLDRGLLVETVRTGELAFFGRR